MFRPWISWLPPLIYTFCSDCAPCASSERCSSGNTSCCSSDRDRVRNREMWNVHRSWPLQHVFWSHDNDLIIWQNFIKYVKLSFRRSSDQRRWRRDPKIPRGLVSNNFVTHDYILGVHFDSKTWTKRRIIKVGIYFKFTNVLFCFTLGNSQSQSRIKQTTPIIRSQFCCKVDQLLA